MLEGLADAGDLQAIPQASLAELGLAARTGEVDAAIVDAMLPDEGWPLVIAERLDTGTAPFVPTLLLCQTVEDASLAKARCETLTALPASAGPVELVVAVLKGMIATQRLAA